MSLNADEMIRIQKDLVNGKEPTIKGDEADEYRKELAVEIEECRKKGIDLKVPSEW